MRPPGRGGRHGGTRAVSPEARPVRAGRADPCVSIVQIDITAADALRSLCTELAGRGIVVALARVKQDLLVDP